MDWNSHTAPFTPLSTNFFAGITGIISYTPQDVSESIYQRTLLSTSAGYGPATACYCFPEFNQGDRALLYRFDTPAGGVSVLNTSFISWLPKNSLGDWTAPGSGFWIATNKAQLDSLTVASESPGRSWVFQFYIGNP